MRARRTRSGEGEEEDEEGEGEEEDEEATPSTEMTQEQRVRLVTHVDAIVKAWPLWQPEDPVHQMLRAIDATPLSQEVTTQSRAAAASRRRARRAPTRPAVVAPARVAPARGPR